MSWARDEAILVAARLSTALTNSGYPVVEGDYSCNNERASFHLAMDERRLTHLLGLVEYAYDEDQISEAMFNRAFAFHAEGNWEYMLIPHDLPSSPEWSHRLGFLLPLEDAEMLAEVLEAE